MQSVKEFMSGDPVSIEVGASALEAYETMLRHGIRHLPVLGPGARVVGVVTANVSLRRSRFPCVPGVPSRRARCRRRASGRSASS